MTSRSLWQVSAVYKSSRESSQQELVSTTKVTPNSLPWEFGAVELVESLAVPTHFYFVAPALAVAGQDEAARVIQRPGTHRPGPAPVVLGDAVGDVVEGKAAGAGDHLLNSRLRTVAAAIGWDSGPQQARGILPESSRCTEAVAGARWCQRLRRAIGR